MLEKKAHNTENSEKSGPNGGYPKIKFFYRGVRAGGQVFRVKLFC